METFINLQKIEAVSQEKLINKICGIKFKFRFLSR